LRTFLHRLLLRRIAARLLGNPDQHIGRPAELLQLDIAETKPRPGWHASRRYRPDRIWTALPSACRPLKSMPKFKPWVKNNVIAKIESSAEMGKTDASKPRKNRTWYRRGRSEATVKDRARWTTVQHGNENAQPDENQMCHNRLRILKSARFAAASISPSLRR